MTNNSGQKPYGRLINILFHVIVVVVIVMTHNPERLSTNSSLIRLLWLPSNKPYLGVGVEAAPFKPYLPKTGAVSIVTDDLENSAKQREFWYGAQNLLAPLLITKEQTQPLMIVYCSNDVIAEAKMSAAGYRWFKQLADGKGVAIKKP